MPLLKPHILAVALLATALGGCDQLGIETPDKVAARVEAEGKAVGGACRHAGMALQDCYMDNKKASKAAIYAGWRDMDSYMRENSIAEVKPAADAPEPATDVEATREAAKKSSKDDAKAPTQAAARQRAATPGDPAANTGEHASTDKIPTKTS